MTHSRKIRARLRSSVESDQKVVQKDDLMGYLNVEEFSEKRFLNENDVLKNQYIRPKRISCSGLEKTKKGKK